MGILMRTPLPCLRQMNSRESPPSLARPIGCALLVALVTTVTFWPLVRHEYIEWDDPHNVFRNPHLHPATAANLIPYWDPRKPAHGLYVPMTHTVWFIIAPVARDADGSLNPRVYHAANLLVHVLCAVGVYALLQSLVHNHVAAVIGALLFSLHPVQVETVAWISGLKDVLAGLFCVIALWLYVLSRSKERAPTKRTVLYLISMSAFLLALLSKPVPVVLPLLAAVIDWGLLARRPGAVAMSLAPWLILALPVALITRSAQWTPEVHAMTAPSVRPLIMGDALAFYIWQVLFPARLALDYGRTPSFVALNPLNWLCWLVPLGIGGGLFLLRRRVWGVVVGAIFFLLALLPVLGIVPFSAQIHSSVADHYLYLPMVGLALSAAWGAARVSLRTALIVALPILMALSARSWNQTWHWRDTTTIFAHALQVNPRSWISRINLGAEALARNDGTLAELHTRAAMKLRPNDALLWLNLGVALGQQSRFAEAAEALRQSIRMNPGYAQSYYFLGQALLQLGEREQAAEAFRAAYRIDPTFRAK